MFIELHNTDGDPFLLNVDEIKSVRQGVDNLAVISLRGMTYGNVIPQESYEKICTTLFRQILRAKSGESEIHKLWESLMQCGEPAKVELGFDTTKGPGD